MMRIFKVIAAATFTLGVLGDVAGQYSHPNAEEIDLKIEILNDTTLPYQALRVRSTLRNVSERRIGPLVPFSYLKLKGPNGPMDAGFQSVPAPLIDKDRMSVPNNVTMMSIAVPLFLEPNEYTSITYSVGMSGGAVFRHPGTYWMQVSSPVSGKRDTHVYKTIEFTINVPAGDDDIVHSLLKKNPGLIWALLHPINAPEKADLPLIKKIIKDHPNSTYATYAHFALARAWGKGVELPSKSRRVCLALIADELDKIIKNRLDPVRKQVVADSFPYRPQALLMKSLASPSERLSCRRWLNVQHEDSVEWLEEYAGMLMGGARDVQNLTGRKWVTDTGMEIPGVRDELWRAIRVKR